MSVRPTKGETTWLVDGKRETGAGTQHLVTGTDAHGNMIRKRWITARSEQDAITLAQGNAYAVDRVRGSGADTQYLVTSTDAHGNMIRIEWFKAASEADAIFRARAEAATRLENGW